MTSDNKNFRTAMMDCDASATINYRREMTDFRGRMDQVFCEIDNVLYEYENSDVIDRQQAQQLYESLTEMAGLAVAQATHWLDQYPGIDED